MSCGRLAALLLLLVPLAACGAFTHQSVGRDADPAPDAGTSEQPDPKAFPPPPAGSVRIAAYNVHQLFDTTCDSGRCGPGDYEQAPTPAEFAAQASEIAHAIDLLDAGIVLVEEVETQASMDALTQRLPAFSHAVLGETGGTASVDVGVLSLHPITQVVRHRSQTLTRPDGTTTSFAREFLEVHLDVGSKPVIVFASHFRSKVNDDPGRRLAEAQAAHDIVLHVAEQNPQALVVMGGDLNDTPGSPPIDALEAGGELLRVASDQPVEAQGSYLFGGTANAIDHLFVAIHAAGSYVPHSFHVARDDGARGWGGSDHGAVLADFVLP